jgi:hypothetical protein
MLIGVETSLISLMIKCGLMMLHLKNIVLSKVYVICEDGILKEFELVGFLYLGGLIYFLMIKFNKEIIHPF